MNFRNHTSDELVRFLTSEYREEVISEIVRRLEENTDSFLGAKIDRCLYYQRVEEN